jgi:preprotein translocase subunit SecA
MMRMAEKSLLLQILDQTWKDHLLSLDHLRQGINLRAYAQRDPLNEYKREAFELFEGMLVQLRDNITSVLSHIEFREPPPLPPPEIFVSGPSGTVDQFAELREREPAMADGDGGSMFGNGFAAAPARRSERQAARAAAGAFAGQPAGPRAPWAGTPRNAPCPCGSGKKYKHCHGRV